ncbi:hypothetical protein AGABI1DRAFT_114846 [Agaricus bisporus var. burnettii JB137-S8]|uniref:Uncharacterized protein n=1 Tax=Agaricus bisporus var. burnettii (strain JB137-S8 / ATCC MYA-4627 / FGSC 10392) TaxID=597362 RepID=K5VU50_AGABU|nr:uncharacterized protein AGABI1DRAFT_114846 [Agaricus bisporus var. burnettii JB137-S8]EKM77994.1 hypothetical protein AGABI1DRAFT_114846 [Agaricus bisporus var. burnettii JB137-S8]
MNVLATEVFLWSLHCAEFCMPSRIDRSGRNVGAALLAPLPDASTSSQQSTIPIPSSNYYLRLIRS